MYQLLLDGRKSAISDCPSPSKSPTTGLSPVTPNPTVESALFELNLLLWTRFWVCRPGSAAGCCEISFSPRNRCCCIRIFMLSATLAGAIVGVTGHQLNAPPTAVAIAGATLCFGIRLRAIWGVETSRGGPTSTVCGGC